MTFRNRVIAKGRKLIKLDTSGSIEVGVISILKVEIYKCPLRLDSVEWKIEQGVLTVNEPGRYLVTYE